MESESGTFPMATHMHTARATTLSKYPCVLLLSGIALALASPAFGDFFVDDYEVDEVGTCNVESWISFASNKDFMAVTSPTCVVKIGIPVEIGAEYQRNRESDAWKTSGAVSGKITLLPMTNGIGVGLAGQTNWNLLSGASTGGNIYVPVTFDVGHNLRWNLNGGYLYDATTKFSYATWGTSLEWQFHPKVALIGEIFGQAGPTGETISTTQPRFQTGIRYSVTSNTDVSLIYGRNINGENANWITLDVNFGFKAQ